MWPFLWLENEDFLGGKTRIFLVGKRTFSTAGKHG